MPTPRSVPPSGYTAADAELLGVVQSIELAVRDLYQAAIDGGADDDVWTGLRDNHRAYADVISGMVGRAAPGRRDDAFYEEQVGSFEATGEELATAAYDLESTLLATHTELLGELEGVDGARAIASIVTVVARHCAVLADLSGQGDDPAALFENSAEPLELAGGAQG